ncbi:MAG: hypothetical protein ACLU4J_25555 [Butyricimonas paravirosa]
MNVVAILFQSVRNKSIDTFRHNKVKNYVALYSRMLSERMRGWMRKRRLNGYISIR